MRTNAAELVKAVSPDGRNAIAIHGASGASTGRVQFTVTRDGRTVIAPSPLGPVLAAGGDLGANARSVSMRQDNLEEHATLLWGKSKALDNRCRVAEVVLETPDKVQWQVDVRAYDDGVAIRYRVPAQDKPGDIELREEITEFRIEGEATALFSGYDNYTSSHEATFERKPVGEIPAEKLLEMPLLMTWPDGRAAAITEARVRQFAGMYLQRAGDNPPSLRARLSPLPTRPEVCVAGATPIASPWRVVLLADHAGKLLESNLLLCLNDPPPADLGDFAWLRPGKTTFHWWYGAFEDDYKPSTKPGAYLARHQAYIDFCARNHIAYHSVSGDGRAWYVQSSTDYGTPSLDADILTPRPEIELPKILAYARQRGVGIRLWVHWKPLSKHLEEAFALYESWGVKGLMVDFLDRDDQNMNDFTEQMLARAARHKLHIQIHGSPKFSGEQRTFPNLFNREGVMNLEYLKWSDLVTPDHNVNVAYVRALAGPVDYHLGGFRSVSRAEFKPQDRAPVVMGTRCHHLALYVVYENPMPMVADAPSSYEGQPGFDFIAEVPTTWDETRFVYGEPGELIVMARRLGDAWYLGGITNWTRRDIAVPLGFLGDGKFTAKLYVDGSMDEAQPNEVSVKKQAVEAKSPLAVSFAPGGGFVAVIRPATATQH